MAEIADIKPFEPRVQGQVRIIDEKLNTIAQGALSALAQEELRRRNGDSVSGSIDDFFSTIAEMNELNNERENLLNSSKIIPGGNTMANIVNFESKENLINEKIDMIDKIYEKERNASDTFARQILLRTENGGSLTDNDIDNMISDLAFLSDIKDEKDAIRNK